MRPPPGCSRSPAASSRPGGGWPSRSSTGWSSARAASRRAAPTTSRSGWRPPTPSSSRPRASPSPTCRRAIASCSAFRYGHFARNVLRLAGERPELAAPIVDGSRTCSPRRWSRRASSRRAASRDVLLRRTRLGLLAAPQLRTAAQPAPVAEALGGELGWSAERVVAARPNAGSQDAAARASTPRRPPEPRPPAAVRRRRFVSLRRRWPQSSRTCISPTCTPARRPRASTATASCAASS